MLPRTSALAEVKIRSSCDACLKTKVKCSQGKESCSRCLQHGRPCVYSQYRKIGRPSFRDTGRKSASKTKSPSPSQSQNQNKSQSQSRNQNAENPHTSDQAQAKAHAESQTEDQQQHEKGLCSPSHSSLSDDASAFADLTNLMDQNIPDAELSSNFPDYLDFSMGEFDWSAPESAEALTTFEVGCDIGSQTFVDNLLAITSSPDSLESMGQLSANPTYFAAVAQTEQLFSPPATASLAAKTMPHELQLSSPKELVNKSSQSPNTTPSRACDLSLYCQSPSRCTLQCHAILNMHLSDLSAMRAKEPRATLDVLLDLDGRIGQARDKVLSCPVCLASPACAQTIMLISIVVENLLALFESSCASPDADELESGQQQHDSGYGRLDAGLTDASLDSKSSKCWMRTRHSLPYTRGQLTVGTIHIDESVKVGFSRWLIRLYLERQIAVVKELNLLLAREIGARENVIFKVTVELLLDIERRLEYFVGFIMMIAGPG